MGNHGESFAGQSIGPFMLPCHMQREFGEWKTRMIAGGDLPMCAGAAKFRSNLGISELLPECLGRLPSDHETVFSDHAELLAHHNGTTLEQERERVKNGEVLEMLAEAFKRSQTSGVTLAIPVE